MADRRRVLKVIGGALMAALGAALAVPAALFYTSPARKKRETEAAVDVGAVERLPEGAPVRVPVTVKRRLDAWTAFTDVTLGAAWLIRKGAEIKAFSTVCPHAGCSIDWDAPKKCFACPCHGSVFDADGQRTEGPSPRGMDTLDVEVKEGRVLVAYKRFRQGVGDKEPT
jgi:menaquinol-cytochrome c reductase iron-sulfur subunit